ncbi:baculoviral IAP repeat-containing protein 5.1-like isoform X2 [Dendrobates tinctorius]|uniref:baculoviral IAP repeat-containing protein 5.1-like isoform X2 n=1 Tax=Dendrobates tinctorius TaxID=92724 RepID=UPI003CC9A515
MHGVKKRVMQVLQHLKDFRIMYDYNKRLSTFTDWPFTENCKCTPENMAKAGFVHCPTENEPDVACCFFCLKELEGWEPDDDPMTEHSKRSVTCGFLSLTKNTDDLTMEEFLRLEVFRIKTFYGPGSPMCPVQCVMGPSFRIWTATDDARSRLSEVGRQA